MSVKEKIRSIFPYEESIPKEFRFRGETLQKEYLLDGKLCVWNGPMREVLSPVFLRHKSGISQRVVGAYPLLTERESLAAMNAAVRAYDNGNGPWPKMPVSERIRHVEEFLSRMQEKKMDVIHLLMWEIGKSFDESEKEFDRTVGYIRNTIDALQDFDRASSRFVAEQGIMGRIRRAPLGVVLCMGPFNYPLNETFTTLIPALLMGNTVILKPPRLGVLLHYPLLQALHNSFPAGVVNTVYGDGRQVVTPIMSSGKVNVLAFIGSSKVADLLKSQHPRPLRLRSVLGLEAKNAAIVLPDADMDASVRECVTGSLLFNGQRCTAVKILFVHTKVVGTFLERFALEMESLKFGMPWEDGVVITPLPEPDRITYLSELVEDAKEKGARIMNSEGGSRNRSFFYPALLYPVNTDMRIYYEEQFGPVVPVVPFDDIETPIRYCIESSYGQQVSLFGNDPSAIVDIANVLVNQVCRVNINSMCQRGPDMFPFAGRKDSGEGTLSVSDALRVFSIRTIIAARETKGNRELFSKMLNQKKLPASVS